MMVGMGSGIELEMEFSGEIWYWRGPSPFYFVTVPEEESLELQEMSAVLSYGWGCIPVGARIGDTEWTTALFPKDGLYALPVKVKVRRALGLDEGDTVKIRMSVSR